MSKKSNLFSEPYPLAKLWAILNEICPSEEDYYLIDENAFDSMVVFKGTHISFLEDLKTYYYPCQQFYVTRPFNYKSFTTLLRQLCNYHNVNFRIDKHYNHSKLTIRYFIEKDKTEE
jgi:hypothetical protein